MNAKQICGVIVALCVTAIAARADSLELKNGSPIKGKFMGGTQSSISFQVGSSVQSYDIADVRSLRFESEAQDGSPSVPSRQPTVPSSIEKNEVAQSSSSVTISAGTRISVRTIDSIDSAKNRVGYRFEASLEEMCIRDRSAEAANTKTGSILGTVVDMSDDPVPDATCLLYTSRCV